MWQSEAFKNYDKSITPIKPTEIVKQTYILLIPHDKDKIVIIHTGLVMNRLPNRTDKLYYLAEPLDNGTNHSMSAENMFEFVVKYGLYIG